MMEYAGKALVSVWLAGLLALTGCVTTSSSPDASSKEELTPERQAEIVKRRFQERWDALIAKDYAKAYSYLSPSTRALVPQEQFTARFSRGNFKKAEFKEIACKEDVCEVSFLLTYDHAAMKGVVTPTGEKWFFRDGEAWFNLPD
jgi:hypothetical protein